MTHIFSREYIIIKDNYCQLLLTKNNSAGIAGGMFICLYIDDTLLKIFKRVYYLIVIVNFKMQM